MRERVLKIRVEELGEKLQGAEERPTEAAGYVLEHATKGDPASVLGCLDDFAVNRGFLMNLGPEKAPLLEETLRLLGRDLRVLELGCYCGYSAIAMARNLEGEGRLVSVEKSAISVAAATGIIDHAGVGDRVEIFHGESDEALSRLEGEFDLVFLDHWKGLYRRDLGMIEARGLLRPGSVVFADNVGPMFGAEEYLDYVRGCGRFESRNEVSTIEYTDIVDAVEISTYRGAGRVEDTE